MKHRFHPAAEAEHLEQVAWLEQQQAGLGRRYLESVEAAIARACAAPQKHRVALIPDVRRVTVNGFPFAVLFRESDGVVQIVAIPHYRRRPGYWLGRLA